MPFQSIDRRFLAGAAVSLMLAAAGCQSENAGGVLGIGGSDNSQPAQPKITQSELEAYCPRTVLRDGTAYYNTYQKNGQDDPSKLIYQASIADITRQCARGEGTTTMTVAVAGKIVPGPAGAAGTITMPIRVAVVQGEQVLYSELHQHQVAVSDAGAATQFLFTDPNVTFPSSSARNIRVFVGYDEGPTKKTAESD